MRGSVIAELLETASDSDLLRQKVVYVAQRLKQPDVEGMIGAGHGERCEGRENWHNGYRKRDLDYANPDGGVRSGGDVESAYAELLDPATDAGRRTELETAMVTYCDRDTLALVRLVEFFEGVAPA